jgi:hypothetical protein
LFEVVDKLPPGKRRRLDQQFFRIQQYPGNSSNYSYVDPKGRLLRVSIFDELALYYWIDDADQHIKILRIAKRASG